jgi:2'-5' RNA ligase superfamily
MPDGSPLILSAVLDTPVRQRLDALRRAHFPPERNHLDAHVTLFHHLPGAQEDAVADAVARAARRAPPAVDVTGVRSLGRGVAVVLASPELAALRAGLARGFAPWLTAQDRAKRDLDVTVQNKVAPNRHGRCTRSWRRRSPRSARRPWHWRCGATAEDPGSRSRGSCSPGNRRSRSKVGAGSCSLN